MDDAKEIEKPRRTAKTVTDLDGASVHCRVKFTREMWDQVSSAATIEGDKIASYVRQCVYRDLKSKGLAK